MLKAFYEGVDLNGYQIVNVEVPLSSRLYTDESEATDFMLVGIIANGGWPRQLSDNL